MHRTKIVLGLVAIVVTINAFPQQRQENGESPGEWSNIKNLVELAIAS